MKAKATIEIRFNNTVGKEKLSPGVPLGRKASDGAAGKENTSKEEKTISKNDIRKEKQCSGVIVKEKKQGCRGK